MTIALWFAMTLMTLATGFNGDSDARELACPDECECDFLRINWVTDCSESNLTDVPDAATIDPSVYILDLNGNAITDVHAASFPADCKLRRLQLANNLLTDVRRDSFADLHYIIDADFAGNRIRRIDPHAFESQAGFLTLELQDNPLDAVEGPFLYSDTLLYLDISNCSLRVLNSAFFEHISALQNLDLSDNPLEVLNAFAALSSLSALKLNRCNLTTLAVDTFAAQANLRSLELAGNRFHQVAWPPLLAALVRLEYIDLRDAGLRAADIPPNTFDHTIYLQTLLLTNNSLGADFDVAATIGAKLEHLEVLDLSYCQLGQPLSEDAFAQATRLKTLYLAGNTLLAADLLLALAPLVRLQKLTLSHSGLSRLPDTFDKFKSLIELDISHNPLNDVFVKLLAPLETLEYLNMGYSNLSHIAPTTFTKMTSLRRLVLSGNDLNSLEAGLFADLTRLESLELNACGLRRPLNATVFFENLTYTDLTELMLAGNPLRVSRHGPLLPTQLSRLETLDLSNCNLTFLPVEAFAHTTKLTRLILAGNRFSVEQGLAFLQSLPRLKVLDVRHNLLTEFTADMLVGNREIERLRLVGNPWRCDCWVAELWRWATTAKGNLDVLEGAILDGADVSVGKMKRKRLLVCNYDGRTPMPAVMAKRAQAANRTWAKYVRESGCEVTMISM